jgi:hypothetical protein
MATLTTQNQRAVTGTGECCPQGKNERREGFTEGPSAATTSGVRPDEGRAERKLARCPKCGQLVEVFEGRAYRGSDWFAAHRLPVPVEMRHGPPLRIRCAGSFTSAPRAREPRGAVPAAAGA